MIKHEKKILQDSFYTWNIEFYICKLVMYTYIYIFLS